MRNSTSCSASAATFLTHCLSLHLYFAYILIMSFKQNIKKESYDSNDVILVKEEFDLTQRQSSSTEYEYETTVTHISESKYFK